jgi:hypothetical protein
MNSNSGLILALVVYRPTAIWLFPRYKDEVNTVWETQIVLPRPSTKVDTFAHMECVQHSEALYVRWLNGFVAIDEDDRHSGPLKPGDEILRRMCTSSYKTWGKGGDCLFDMRACASFEEAAAWIKSRVKQASRPTAIGA